MAVQVATSRVAEILEQIAALPDDWRLVLHGKTWDEYQELLDELGEHRRVLVSFAEGVLEIMLLSRRHEHVKEFILHLVFALTEELDIELETAGSTTLQLESAQRGVEPDTSFFIQHAALMVGKDEYDLLSDPPPDIIVEVDVAHPSYSKMSTYAHFGVPEVWRYHKTVLHIFTLVNGNYLETATSRAFPFLQARDLMAFIEQSSVLGHNSVIKNFRAWVRTHKSA